MSDIRKLVNEHPLVALALAGTLIRLVISPFLSHVDDVSMWALIAENIRAGEPMYDVPGLDYTPGWGYVLQLVTVLCDLIGVGTFATRPEDTVWIMHLGYFDHYGLVSSVSFNIVVKLPLIAVDILVAYVLSVVVRQFGGSDRACIIAFALWMLLPPSILITAAGGMFDNICALFFLISLSMLLSKRFALSGVAMGIAFMMKMFPVASIVAFAVYMLATENDKKSGIKNVALFIGSMVLVCLVMLIPQFIDDTWPEAFNYITYRLTANGYSDTITAEGLKKLAAVFMAGVALIILTVWMYRRCRDNDKALAYSSFMAIGLCIIVCGCLPQYLTQIIPLAIIIFLVFDRRMKWAIMILTILYLARFSVTLPDHLVSLAEYTNLLSVDSVYNMLDWENGDGFLNKVFNIVAKRINAVVSIAVLASFAILIFRKSEIASEEEN